MSIVQNPSYYGLVKQSGPWNETPQDKLFGQKPYKYTPNNSVTAPYKVRVSNANFFESYSSKSIIYDAALAPVMIKEGKLKKGKIMRAKKVVLIDAGGRLVNPTDSYFLNKFGQELKNDNYRALENAYGSVNDLVAKGIEPLKPTDLASLANAAEPDRPYHKADSIGSSLINGFQTKLRVNDEVVMAEPIVSNSNQNDSLMIGVDVDVPYGEEEFYSSSSGEPKTFNNWSL